MRFRQVSSGTSWLWVLVACLQIFTETSRIRRQFAEGKTGHIEFDCAMVLLWLLIGALHLWFLFFSRVEITETDVRTNQLFRKRVYSLSTIIGIRPAYTSGGRLMANSVELEIARLRADIFPHEYVKLQVDDATMFARELHERIPAATYEPVGTKLESSIA